MTSRKIVLFELNEVPYRILDDFLKSNPTSNLVRILERASMFETVSEDMGHLSPWITWPSVHRGVSNEKHGIAHFGQPLAEVDQAFPPIWAILAKSDLQVGVFGSLHSFPVPDDRRNLAFYVPDTFAAGPECHPAGISTFQAFNLAMVDASGRNVSDSLPLKLAARFMVASPRLGVTARTVFDTARQLIHELVRSSIRCRRRTLQAAYAFDIFCRQLSRNRPQFATFFTNHVASAMHRYWAAAYPGDYGRLEYTQAWQRTFASEISHAMRHAAKMIERLVWFCDRNRDYCLVIASSMGQAAAHGEVIRSQLYLVHADRFVNKLGVPPSAWSRRRSMQPDVNLVISAGHVQTFREALAGVRLNGRQLSYTEKVGGFFGFAFGDANLDDRTCRITLHGREFPVSEFGFENVMIQDQAGSTGYHVPQGILLVYDPQSLHPDHSRTEVSTLDIAPAILRCLGVTPPDYMRQRSPLAQTLH